MQHIPKYVIAALPRAFGNTTLNNVTEVFIKGSISDVIFFSNGIDTNINVSNQRIEITPWREQPSRSYEDLVRTIADFNAEYCTVGSAGGTITNTESVTSVGAIDHTHAIGAGIGIGDFTVPTSYASPSISYDNSCATSGLSAMVRASHQADSVATLMARATASVTVHDD